MSADIGHSCMVQGVEMHDKQIRLGCIQNQYGPSMSIYMDEMSYMCSVLGLFCRDFE